MLFSERISQQRKQATESIVLCVSGVRGFVLCWGSLVAGEGGFLECQSDRIVSYHRRDSLEKKKINFFSRLKDYLTSSSL